MAGIKNKSTSSSGWWVTIAENDLDGWNAIILCKSIQNTLSNKEICVFIHHKNVSKEMRLILHDVFDYVIDFNESYIPPEELRTTTTTTTTATRISTKYLLVLNLWNVCLTKKAIFIQPWSLMLKNCDELFEVEDEFLGVESAGKNNSSSIIIIPFLFVFKPNKRNFDDLKLNFLKWSRSNINTQLQEFLNSYFHQSNSIDPEYNFHVGDSQMSCKENTFICNSLVKLCHYFGANKTPWYWQLNQDNNNVFANKWIEIYNKLFLQHSNLLGRQLKDYVTLCTAKYKFPQHEESLLTSQMNEGGPSVLDENDLLELGETISIIGLSCRFPGANNENEFWEVLYEGRDETKSLPNSRHFTRPNYEKDVETPVGYLKCPIEDFDAKFFEISRREAEYMDPQQRLLLEVSWESLENAGINPQSLYGSNTAVFVGLWAQEYCLHITNESTVNSNINSIGIGSSSGNAGGGGDFQHKYLGNALCFCSARISHCLGLRGPSVAREAGCASALEGLHYACAALRSKETDLALSCGVNIALGFSGELSSLDSFILCKDGKCKTFDESANGFARGESVVSLVLKRTGDAIRDGNTILGIIRGSALNNDGAGSTLGTPNAVAQELVIKEALKNAKVSPNEISYVEAHGTGTPIGDPIEFHALNQVFRNNNSLKRSQPLYVGSLKTNIGHTEGSSGLSGLVKVLLSMRHHIIPKHLHLNKLNPNINLDLIPAIIPSQNIEWKSCSSRLGLVAGISSFGMSGTNVHVIVQEPPPAIVAGGVKSLPCNQKLFERTAHLFVLSAKSEPALKDLISKYVELIRSNSMKLNLADITYSASTGRAHFRHRIAIVCKVTTQLLTRLEKGSQIYSGIIPSSNLTKRKIAFLFTGQGSQYACMAETLYKTSPIFKWEFDKCSDLLFNNYNLDLSSILSYSNSSSTINSDSSSVINKLDDSIFSQPAIFCIQICLAKLWMSFGIAPDVVLGHSVGEFAAAVVAGILSLEDGLSLVVERSQLVDHHVEPGGMLVVKTSVAVVEKLLTDFQNSIKVIEGNPMSNRNKNRSWIDIAAINSESEVVVSGQHESINQFEIFCTRVGSGGLGTQRLNATHAFHSRAMDCIQTEYQTVANSVKPKEVKCTYISGTFAKCLKFSDFNPSYWIQHLRNPVHFASAFKLAVDECKCNTFIEIGPQPILLSLGLSCIQTPIENNPHNSMMLFCPSIRKNEDNWITILTSLAKLYINGGLEIDWFKVDASYNRIRVSLPTYSFQHEKFWFVGKSSSSFSSSRLDSMIINSSSNHPLLGSRIPSPLVDSISYHSSISLIQLPYLKDHKIADKFVLPAAGYLEIIFGAGRDILCGGFKVNVPLVIEHLIVESAVELSESGTVELQTILSPKVIMAAAENSQQTSSQLEYDVCIYKQLTFDSSCGSDAGKWKKVASATFIPTSTIEQTNEVIEIEGIKSKLMVSYEPISEIYNKLAETGIQFGSLFQSVGSIWYSIDSGEFLVEIISPLSDDDSNEITKSNNNGSNTSISPYICHPVVLDAMIQSTVSLQILKQKDLKGLLLPMMINKCISFPITSSTSASSSISSQLYVHCQPTSISETQSKQTTCVSLYNGLGQRLGLMEGLELISTTVPGFLRLINSDVDEYPGFYEESWIHVVGPRERRINCFKYFQHSSNEEFEERSSQLLQFYTPIMYQVDDLCFHFILKAIISLIGLNNIKKGDLVSIPKLISSTCILPRHKSLLTRWFDILQEEGYVCCNKNNSEDNSDANNSEKYLVIKSMPSCAEIETRILETNEWFIKNEATDIVEYRFVSYIGEYLAELIQGKLSPTSLMFSTGNEIGASILYQSEIIKFLHESIGILNRKILNTMLEDFEKEGRSKTDVCLRILEIGAGSGAATEAFKIQLDFLGIPYEYTVSDVSQSLLNGISNRLLHPKNFKYKILDINQDPTAQGFSPNYFDIIMTDNVLHVTVDLTTSLRHVRLLLVPHGQFIFTELQEKFRVMDVSYGFMEEWWRFKDYELRIKSPTVNPSVWTRLLERNGFKKKDLKIISGGDIKDGFSCYLIMAFASSETEYVVTNTLTSIIDLAIIENTIEANSMNIKDNSKSIITKSIWMIVGYQNDSFTNEIITGLNQLGKECLTLYKTNNSCNCNKDNNEEIIRMKESNSFIVDPSNPNHFIQLFEVLNEEGYIVEGILYLWGINSSISNKNDNNFKEASTIENEALTTEANLTIVSVGFLHLIHGLASTIHKYKSKLIVVTKGIELLPNDSIDLCSIHNNNPIAASLWGILLTFKNEFSNHTAMCIDLDANESDYNSSQDLLHTLWLNDEIEHQVLFRNGQKFVKRLINIENYKSSIPLPNSDRFKLENPSSGSFSDFNIVSAARPSCIRKGDVEVKVACCALNFKDILIAMKSDSDNEEYQFQVDLEKIPDSGAELGVDFSGVITCIGRDQNEDGTSFGSSSKYKVGDRVFGLVAGGALSSHVIVTEKRIHHIPSDMSFEEASSLSCAYLTVLHYLVTVAKMKANDKVLIHAASGGVGLAAVQLAQHVGATIFATAGSNRKRNYLSSLGLVHIYSSRNTDYGESILKDTNGEGVNIVLNSLTGTNFKETSLSVCALGARFLEMSKLNVWSKEELAKLRPDVRYYVQNTSESSANELARLESEMKQLTDLLMSGSRQIFGQYKPFPLTTFPLTRAHDAFRYLQEAKHIGKVIIHMPNSNITQAGRIEHKEWLFNPYSSYLITGGLGGIGLEVAKWLIDSGAKYIILVGRNPPTPRAQTIINQLTELYEACLLIIQADVSDFSQCQSIFEQIKDPNNGFPKLRGIFHAAGVIHDGALRQQTYETVFAAFKPKILGTWNLHMLTKFISLDHFVLFSSLASTLGGLGNANHSAANKYLDIFAKNRLEAGLPCTNVNWGAWSDVGVAAGFTFLESTFGMKAFSPKQGIASLRRALLSQKTNTVVFDIHDFKILSTTCNAGNLLNLMKFQVEKQTSTSLEFEARIQDIKLAEPSQRLDKIKEFVEFIVRDTLKLSELEVIDYDQDLREMGIDSLMGMELRARIQCLLTGYETGSLSVHEFQENRTINKISILLTNAINKGLEELKILSSDELLELIKLDSILPDDIILPGSSTTSSFPSSSFTSNNDDDAKSVLLTGVTGHLGPYLLIELLKQNKNFTIYVLIKAKSEEHAKERLENVLDDLDLLPPDSNVSSSSLNNVKYLVGNLTQTNFGLSSDLYDELTLKIDFILHAAAITNLTCSYNNFGTDDIRTNNVIGLLNVLRFATAQKSKPIYFTSTIFAISKLGVNGELPEEFPSDDDYGLDSLKTGYHISKFICEKLLKEASKRGIPVCVIRHHYLCGDSQTGLIPIKRNHLALFMITCQKIQQIPDINTYVTCVAVDVAAKITIILILHHNRNIELSDHGNNVYNINNPKVCRVLDLGEIIKRRGYEFQIVPYNKWRESAFMSEGVELAPLAELYVKDVFSSEIFSKHPLAEPASSSEQEINVNDSIIVRNSDQLKLIIPDIDSCMLSPLELINLHLNYYEALFGKNNTKAFFDSSATSTTTVVKKGKNEK